MASTYDLIVVGGGIVGCGIVERLRGELSRVCLVEQGPRLGSGASSAAIGGINPHLGDDCMGPLGLMAQHSRELFPAWIDRIASVSERAIPLLPTGLLQVAADEKELDRLANEVMPVLAGRGLGAELLDARQARAKEPLLGPGVAGGLFQPADLAVEPPLIMDALSRILTGPGGPELLLDTTVTAVETGAADVTVVLADGRTLTADRVVIAAGHLSRHLLGLPEDVLFPIKGQALEFAPRPGRALSVQCDSLVVDDAGEHVVFAVPRPDGRIAAGVTFEVGVDDTVPTEEARRTNLHHLSLIFGDLASAPVTRVWAGIRPGTRDAVPVLGHVDADRRILAATGHYGMGITLAPVTIDLAAKLLLGLPVTDDDQRDLDITRPDRFDQGGPSWARPTI
ncbi:NAD(P)/FAD-dependent oxidoreductase [Actinocorallia longicatena]|uniref:Glycine oxidase ThiO n=1 Tax=Actinocorallia longicatena TaxID=111803 RepID=A0ABP6QAJ9_9ACTN